MSIRKSLAALTTFEWGLWMVSLGVVTLSFLLGGEFYLLTLVASLVGVTALIFVAKGDVLGQLLTILFSLLYAVISLQFRYYGEMITYLGMTAPIAGMAVVSWLRNPYQEGKNEVRVARLCLGEWVRLAIYAAAVTTLFYFILAAFDTANLAISTLSVTTSFLASYLTYRRSAAYALAYGANDLVLVLLWVLATLENPVYLPMVVCFLMFFCNDLYGFFSWRRMHLRQQAGLCMEGE